MCADCELRIYCAGLAEGRSRNVKLSMCQMLWGRGYGREGDGAGGGTSGEALRSSSAQGAVTNYCAEGLQALPARPSGKGTLETGQSLALI